MQVDYALVWAELVDWGVDGEAGRVEAVRADDSEAGVESSLMVWVIDAEFPCLDTIGFRQRETVCPCGLDENGREHTGACGSHRDCYCCRMTETLACASNVHKVCA